MDSQKCEAAGSHQIATRHSLSECPVGARTAEDILHDVAIKQGWNPGTKIDLMLRYIDTLGGPERPQSFKDFLQGIADEENGVTTTVPDLSMDVNGEYGGNAYPETQPYRIVIKQGDDVHVLTVEDSAGTVIGTTDIDEDLADGITRMANTDHSLAGYLDDAVIPGGMTRSLEWTLATDLDHTIRLNENEIDEIAAWLRYATGDMEWDGGEVWEY